jgi:hypothetical protein
VDVLLEITVQDMLEDARIAVIVLGRHNYQPIRPHYCLGKSCIDPFTELSNHDASDVLAQPTLPWRAEDHRN